MARSASRQLSATTDGAFSLPRIACNAFSFSASLLTALPGNATPATPKNATVTRAFPGPLALAAGPVCLLAEAAPASLGVVPAEGAKGPLGPAVCLALSRIRALCSEMAFELDYLHLCEERHSDVLGWAHLAPGTVVFPFR